MKKRNTTTRIEEDVLAAEREAVKLFLSSVEQEFNSEFGAFTATVDYSARLPQLVVREIGKI